MKPALAKSLLVEFAGTLTLVFSALAILFHLQPQPIGHAAIAAGLGLATAVLLQLTAPHSPGLLNPALVAGQWAAGTLDWRSALSLFAVQLAASAAAAWLFLALLADRGGDALLDCRPALRPGFAPKYALVLEAVMTGLLVLTQHSRTQPERPASVAWPMGAAVAFATLVLWPWTGAAMNPARAFGPALVTGTWAGQAIYWIGPLAGAVAAGWFAGRGFKTVAAEPAAPRPNS